MAIFKNYKKLYEVEHENVKKLTKRNSELQQEKIELQKKTGIAKLRKDFNEIANMLEQAQEIIQEYKEETARLKLELEDTKGFLEQENQAKEFLKKERTKYRKLVTSLGGDWRNINNGK